MDIEIVITKQKFIIFTIAILIFAGMIFAVAYNPSFAGSNAVVLGHSADEIQVKLADGSVVTLQQLLTTGLDHTHEVVIPNYPVYNVKQTFTLGKSSCNSIACYPNDLTAQKVCNDRNYQQFESYTAASDCCGWCTWWDGSAWQKRDCGNGGDNHWIATLVCKNTTTTLRMTIN
jgi:hypothetical protein